MRFPRIFSLIALLGLVACGGAPRDVLYECVVRDAGYDSVAVYRIPGLVTSNAGTLVAVYDIRHNNVRDLPEDIDIGVSRSTDGGRTWPAENSIVLDTLDCWGYSCLTMIDQSTVGILYESSRAHIFFQAIPLSALFR